MVVLAYGGMLVATIYNLPITETNSLYLTVSITSNNTFNKICKFYSPRIVKLAVFLLHYPTVELNQFLYSDVECTPHLNVLPSHKEYYNSEA